MTCLPTPEKSRHSHLFELLRQANQMEMTARLSTQEARWSTAADDKNMFLHAAAASLQAGTRPACKDIL